MALVGLLSGILILQPNAHRHEASIHIPTTANLITSLALPESMPTTETTVKRASRSSNTPRFVQKSHRGYSSTRECISNVENKDYGRSTNPTHFGKYQFDKPTWVSFGGSPSTWGIATPAEQDQVFNNAMSAGADSRWTPYDGCG